MQRRIILSVLAVASLVLVLAVAAVAVYALADSNPVQVETVPVSAPVQQVERASYEGGCSHSAKMQMTQREAPAEESLLTQAGE